MYKRHEFNNGCVNLIGKGSWLKGTVSGPSGVIDFGNFDAKLTCEGEQFAIQIEPANKLNLDAKVLLLFLIHISEPTRPY